MNSCMEPPKQHTNVSGLTGQALLEVSSNLTALQLHELESLIEKFAPVICLHPEAACLPAAVDDYLHTAMLVNVIDKTAVPVTPFVLSGISQEFHNYYLEPGDDVSVQDPGQSKKTYVRVKAYGAAHTDLQYWFFYPETGSAVAGVRWLVDGTIKGYEGKLDLDPVGRFNGSWERIVVRINNATLEAEQVFFSHDAGGSWAHISKVQRRGSQVVAYASRQSGAFYPAAGVYDTRKVKLNLYSSHLEFCIQQETGHGRELDFSEACQLVSTEYPGEHRPEEPFWLSFPGCWGDPVPEYLNVPAIKQLVRASFGQPLEFLLSGDVLGELVNYLLIYFSEGCRSKSLGPAANTCCKEEETA